MKQLSLKIKDVPNMIEKEKPEIKIKIGKHEYDIDEALEIRNKLNTFFDNQADPKLKDGQQILKG